MPPRVSSSGKTSPFAPTRAGGCYISQIVGTNTFVRPITHLEHDLLLDAICGLSIELLRRCRLSCLRSARRTVLARPADFPCSVWLRPLKCLLGTKKDYFLGFFFTLDCVSTASLILDLTWVHWQAQSKVHNKNAIVCSEVQKSVLRLSKSSACYLLLFRTFLRLLDSCSLVPEAVHFMKQSSQCLNRWWWCGCAI